MWNEWAWFAQVRQEMKMLRDDVIKGFIKSQVNLFFFFFLVT